MDYHHLHELAEGNIRAERPVKQVELPPCPDVYVPVEMLATAWMPSLAHRGAREQGMSLSLKEIDDMFVEF